MSETLFGCTECKFVIYVYIYTYVEVRLSPLSVARASHYVKEAELGYSHFLGCQHGRS